MPLTLNRRVAVWPDVAGLLASFDLKRDQLLTTANPKTARDGRQRIAIHHAMPARGLARQCDPDTAAATKTRGFIRSVADLAERHGMRAAVARHNGCRFATPGCAEACLGFAGHGGMSVDVAACRGRRTMARLADPVTYGRAILWAAAGELAAARAAGLPFALRCNGTDEHPWHRLTFPVTVADAVAIRRRYGVDVATGEALTLADALRAFNDDVNLYEYLKAPADGVDGLSAWRAAGWDITASFAADRPTACRDAIAAVRAGFRVAVPVAIGKGAPIPSRVTITAGGESITLATVDGDASDARFRDPGAVAVILRAKRSRGADPTAAGRFILPDRARVDLFDGCVEFCA